jgi:hypothetical protein
LGKIGFIISEKVGSLLTFCVGHFFNFSSRQNNVTSVEDNARNIPTILPSKWFSGFREEVFENIYPI